MAAMTAATMSGKFILVDGDDDNFDKIMAAVGKLLLLFIL